MARRTTDAFATRTAAVRASLTHGITESVPASLSELVGPRGLRLLLNAGTLVLVLALPYSAAMSARAASSAPDETMPTLAALVPDGVGRAQPISRGVIAGSRSPVTVNTDDVRPVIEYEVKADDTLSDIADHAGVPLRALAFANGITKADEILHVGQKLTIPPGEGALYTVQAGDTVESIAGRFKVDPRVIYTYNRIYFEPEHFAPGQLIFIPGADLPVIKQPDQPRSIPIPAAADIPQREGSLLRPVNGRITQLFWWAHTGVDIAAPYGTTLRASADGVVTATGWVAVGGIRVCVAHSGGLQTCYYHMSSTYVAPGDRVKAGDPIGAIGLTGVTTGPHVHWECRVNNQYVSCLGL